MEKLNLPSYDHKIKYTDDKPLIFDLIRKKYIVLGPEEWVRQHVLNFIIHHHDYPRALISVEGGLKYASRAKRTDIVVFNQNGLPWMVIECKAPEVKIDQKTFDQIAVYNKTLKSPFLMITNGLEHFICAYDQENNGYRFLEDLPAYKKAE